MDITDSSALVEQYKYLMGSPVILEAILSIVFIMISIVAGISILVADAEPMQYLKYDGDGFGKISALEKLNPDTLVRRSSQHFYEQDLNNPFKNKIENSKTDLDQESFDSSLFPLTPMTVNANVSNLILSSSVYSKYLNWLFREPSHSE